MVGVTYCEAYLAENEKALAQLQEQMSPEAARVAQMMAEEWLAEDEEDDED